MSGFTRPANATPIVGDLDVTDGDYLRDGAPLLESGNGFVDMEIPAGAIDDLNTTYLIAFTPYAGSVHLWLNGVLQREGALNDYTIAGDTITFNVAPSTNSTLVASYRK